MPTNAAWSRRKIAETLRDRESNLPRAEAIYISTMGNFMAYAVISKKRKVVTDLEHEMGSHRHTVGKYGGGRAVKFKQPHTRYGENKKEMD